MWKQVDLDRKKEKDEKLKRGCLRITKTVTIPSKETLESQRTFQAGRKKRPKKSEEEDEGSDTWECCQSKAEEDGKNDLGESENPIIVGDSTEKDGEIESDIEDAECEDQEAAEGAELRQLRNDEAIIVPKEPGRHKQRISLEEQYELLSASRERFNQQIHEARLKEFKKQGKRLGRAFHPRSRKLLSDPTLCIPLPDSSCGSTTLENDERPVIGEIEIEKLGRDD
jgi:hypothetical protein